jgi:hypothetical protein
MNIFVLDQDIGRCARYRCDARLKDDPGSVRSCAPLNKKAAAHPITPPVAPCVLWAEKSWDSFRGWRAWPARSMPNTATAARQLDHASIAVLDQVEELRFESRGLTEFAQAMPEHYKVPGDAVAAYRSFYLAEKHAFARWTRRAPPDWWTRDAA